MRNNIRVFFSQCLGLSRSLCSSRNLASEKSTPVLGAVSGDVVGSDQLFPGLAVLLLFFLCFVFLRRIFF